MIQINELHWGQFSQLPNIKRLPLHEQARQYSIYLEQITQERLMYFNLLQPMGGGETPSIQASYTGDLTLVFSNFETVDVLLAGGFDSLSDWNTALVDSGTPYTSISVDEGSSTIYLSGGSNITLKQNAFTGIVEGGLGLGEDLISIVDNGTIIDTISNTFYGCSILEIVNLPVLTSVASFDFYNCVNLRTVQLPLVTTIGEYGFFGAFNTATSPITLNIPICVSFEANWIVQESEGMYFGTTEVDSPKVMTVTTSSTIQFTGEPGWSILLAQNSGVIPNYV